MSKKGVSIVATVGIMLILSMLGIVAVSLLGSSSGLAFDYMQAKAFYAAEAGVQWYSEQLQNDADDWTTPPADTGPKVFPDKDVSANRFFIETANCQPASVDIISTAEVIGCQNRRITRKITFHAVRTLEAFLCAVYSAGKIDTSGTEGLAINGKQKEDAEFLPTVDISYYKSLAGTGQDISGNYTFDTATAPYFGIYSGIWYVDGNVTIDDGVTLNGSIITTGNVNMNNSDSVAIIAAAPYPALVMEGNFLFQNTDNIDVTGLIYVGANFSGNFLAQGSADINFTGTILVAGNFNLSNTRNVTVTYDEAIVDNPPPGFSSDADGQVVDVSNWKEVL